MFHPPSRSRGGGGKSSALRSGDIARSMQAGRVMPKSLAWGNEVLMEPPIQPRRRGMSVRRVDDTAQPGSFSCAQKIVQTGDNSNKKSLIIYAKLVIKEIWHGAEVKAPMSVSKLADLG